jgi:signal recognition particle receptor subunit beta
MRLDFRFQGGFIGELKTVRIFDLPGLLTPCFTGRDSNLIQLHNILQTPTEAETNEQDCIYYRRAAIYGMPGSGKTQLALKYASNYREQYSAVFFVSAARKSTLSDGYERIISLLDLPEKSRTEPAIKIAAARTWLENSRSHDGKNWLLIVDNVNPEIVEGEDQNMDDMDATVTDLVRDFLPREGTSPRGSILLTTRKPRVAETVVGSNSNLCIGLGEMDKKDAVDLLLRASGQANTSDSAETIVKELGYHPLAINQAATLMKVAEIDCEHFLESFHEEKDEVHLPSLFCWVEINSQLMCCSGLHYILLILLFSCSTFTTRIVHNKIPLRQKSTRWHSVGWTERHLFRQIYFVSSRSLIPRASHSAS